MEKIYLLPGIFTATFQDWEKLLKPGKYKDII
jgi:hypothetical protein